MTYKEYGYMPIVGYLAENGLIVGDEFRQGPGAGNLAFVKYCEQQLPDGKRIRALRATVVTGPITNHCQRHGIEFAIGADLDEAVLRAIQAIGGQEWREYQNGHIAETVHCMNKTRQAFRLVVIRRPVQGDLFDGQPVAEKYTVIATNRTECIEQVVKWYNQRGQCSENRIKELKIGFGMERMPCGQFAANAVFFRIGVLAYNVGRLFVLLTLDACWHRHQVQTLRWKLYETAARLFSMGAASG